MDKVGPLAQVVSVKANCGSMDALRAIDSHLTSSLVVVLSSNLITDVPLRAFLMSHHVNSATLSMMFTKRKGSASAQTKPGKAPEV